MAKKERGKSVKKENCERNLLSWSTGKSVVE
jgi:hypothetical protein